VLPVPVMTVGMGDTAKIVRDIGQLVSCVRKLIVVSVAATLPAHLSVMTIISYGKKWIDKHLNYTRKQ